MEYLGGISVQIHRTVYYISHSDTTYHIYGYYFSIRSISSPTPPKMASNDHFNEEVFKSSSSREKYHEWKEGFQASSILPRNPLEERKQDDLMQSVTSKIH